jgi:hypothetical protein
MNKQEFQALASGVAKSLQGAWQTTATNNAEINARLVLGQDQLAIWLGLDHKGKLHISGDYPKWKSEWVEPSWEIRQKLGRTDYGHINYPKIGVTAARGAKAIASEIERRLLPDVRMIWADVLAEIEERQRHYENMLEAQHRVHAALELPPPATVDVATRSDRSHRTVSIYGPNHSWYGSIEISSTGSMDFHIRGVNLIDFQDALLGAIEPWMGEDR